MEIKIIEWPLVFWILLVVVFVIYMISLIVRFLRRKI